MLSATITAPITTARIVLAVTALFEANQATTVLRTARAEVLRSITCASVVFVAENCF